MKRSSKIAVGAVTSFGLCLAVATAFAQPGGMGPGMMRGMGAGAGVEFHGPMGGSMAARMQHDDATFADMRMVHELVVNHDRIKRTVTNLSDGIRTVTESDDPQVAQVIKAHVASMTQRLSTGQEFNMFSHTLPTLFLFENKDKIKTAVETTEKGSIVTQTSNDSAVVAALQGHAVEVSELARDGMVAMMRSARANMVGMMPRGPRAGTGPNTTPAPQAPAVTEHVH
jgi:hypothetical protein